MLKGHIICIKGENIKIDLDQEKMIFFLTLSFSLEHIQLHSSIYVCVSGTHDIHALILGRAITGIQAFTADK